MEARDLLRSVVSVMGRAGSEEKEARLTRAYQARFQSEIMGGAFLEDPFDFEGW